VIALTHVCRAWRDVFLSRPSLWNHLDCTNLGKTRVYLERSKSSPINLSLSIDRLSLSDSFFKFIPHAAGRIRSLALDGDLRAISAYLSRPAPLLETLLIHGGGRDPVLPSAFLNGDLSPLHELYLRNVHTELLWRNMANLTSFTLVFGSPTPVGHLLDFLESAPRLREVHLYSETLATGAQNGRLVSLAHLKNMNTGYPLSHHLFDHLLIPVGARLKMSPGPRSLLDEGRPRFIDNLKNISDFTTIELDHVPAGLRFSGPNGEAKMVTYVDGSHSVLESLAHFDTSKTERLEIRDGESLTSDPLYRVLLPMKVLRTFIITQCEDPHIFVHALHPGMSSSGAMVCPELEELVIRHWRTFDIKGIVGMAAARALRGAKLKTVRITSWDRISYTQPDVSELRKHVLRVEFRCNQP